MTQHYTYFDPDEYDENDDTIVETPFETTGTAAEPKKQRKTDRKKMPFMKKLGMTAALAACAGLVGGGVFTGMTTLASSDAFTKTAVTAEAPANDETKTGTIPGFSNAEPKELPEKADSNEKTETNDKDDLAQAAVPEQANNAAANGEDQTQAAAVENAKVQHEGTVMSVALTGSAMKTAEIAEAVMPAMVAITTTSVQSMQGYYGDLYSYFYGGGNGGRQEYESTAMGTGVIVDQDDNYLYIVTNQHVIENAKELSVAFINNETAKAEVVGEDADNDLAVIKVAVKELGSAALNAVRVAKMGSSAALNVGEDVTAIGNALGYGQSVSVGIVSALDRSMDGGEGVYAKGLIQTDAAINPGNSGGALLNGVGELIGINSAKYASTGVEGMGYAIPIDTAYPIIRSMIDGTFSEDNSFFGNAQQNGSGSGDFPFGGQAPGNGSNGGSGSEGGTEVSSGACLGISCIGISSQYAEYYNIPEGVYINEVMSGSAAEKAGLKAGDIILTFDGKTVTSAEDLTRILDQHEPGDTVSISIARKSGQGSCRTGETEITLGSRNQA